MNFAQQLELKLVKVWYEGDRPGLVFQIVLKILQAIYQVLRFVTRQKAKSERARRAMSPAVLVVGNVIAGGAGKTPVVLAVCDAMKARGYRVGILTRGYKRKSDDQLVLRPGQVVDAAVCGDEPAWLLEQSGCPIAVGANRDQARQALLAAYPDLDLIVSDDGLQHHRLGRSLEWIVFDDRAAGNGKLLPAGPLREPLSRLNSADAIVSTSLEPRTLANQLNRTDPEKIDTLKVQITGFKNLSSGETLDLPTALVRFADQDLLAFTGLGNPKKFFNALVATGFTLNQTLALPDHFDYPPDFCANLEGSVAVTTGKDAVKLKACTNTVWVVQIELELSNRLIEQIEDKIGRPSS